MLAAWRGDAATAGALIHDAAEDGAARGEGRLLGLTGYAAAVLYNGLGRYEEAFAAARDRVRVRGSGFRHWCRYELIEAASRSGAQAAARRGLQRLQVSTRASGTDWGLGALASAQAMLADDEPLTDCSPRPSSG